MKIKIIKTLVLIKTKINSKPTENSKGSSAEIFKIDKMKKNDIVYETQTII